MTEAILAGEDVKKLSLKKSLGIFRSLCQIFPGLPKYFFMGNRPCNAGYRQREHKKRNNLGGETHDYFS